MSQQEIVGEIDMDHGQKGGGGGAAVAGVASVAIILLIRKILYILGLDISQIENGIKKMMMNAVKNTMRNRFTLPIQLQRERMMIVKKAIDKEALHNPLLIQMRRGKNTKMKSSLKQIEEFKKLEAFIYKVKMGMKKTAFTKEWTGNEKRCKKFYGRLGRIQVKDGNKWKEWDEIKATELTIFKKNPTDSEEKQALEKAEKEYKKIKEKKDATKEEIKAAENKFYKLHKIKKKKKNYVDDYDQLVRFKPSSVSECKEEEKKREKKEGKKKGGKKKKERKMERKMKRKMDPVFFMNQYKV